MEIRKRRGFEWLVGNLRGLVLDDDEAPGSSEEWLIGGPSKFYVPENVNLLVAVSSDSMMYSPSLLRSYLL